MHKVPGSWVHSGMYPYVCLFLFGLCKLVVMTVMNITSSMFEPCGHKGALALCEEPNLPALRVSSSNRLIGVYFDVLPIKLVSCYPRLLSISMRRLRLNQACVSCYPLYMYCKCPIKNPVCCIQFLKHLNQNSTVHCPSVKHHIVWV